MDDKVYIVQLWGSDILATYRNLEGAKARQEDEKRERSKDGFHADVIVSVYDLLD